MKTLSFTSFIVKNSRQSIFSFTANLALVKSLVFMYSFIACSNVVNMDLFVPWTCEEFISTLQLSSWAYPLMVLAILMANTMTGIIKRVENNFIYLRLINFRIAF